MIVTLANTFNSCVALLSSVAHKQESTIGAHGFKRHWNLLLLLLLLLLLKRIITIFVCALLCARKNVETAITIT